MMGKKKFRFNSRLFEKLSANFKAWNRGIPQTDETKKKLSNALKGRKLPKSTRQKMSETRKGKPNNFTGHHHSEEARRRISEGMKAYRKAHPMHHTEETKAKISKTKRSKSRV